jgi:hypothetical protein
MSLHPVDLSPLGLAFRHAPRLPLPGPAWQHRDGQFVLEFEVPGLSASDVQVQQDDQVLVVDFGRTGHTRRAGRLTARLPRQADPASLNAQLSRGVLSLKVDTLPERCPRTIQVSETLENGATDAVVQVNENAGSSEVSTSA